MPLLLVRYIQVDTPLDVEMTNKALKNRLLELPRRCAFALSSDMAVRVLGGYSLLIVAE